MNSEQLLTEIHSENIKVAVRVRPILKEEIAQENVVFVSKDVIFSNK